MPPASAGKSTAHNRYQEWNKVGVSEKHRKTALQEYDQLRGIEWRWLAMDGAITLITPKQAGFLR